MKFKLSFPFRKRVRAEVNHGLLRESITHHLDYLELRRSAARLHQLCVDGKIQSIAISSFARGEGKSLITACLAVALARNFGKKILVIDTATYHRTGSVRMSSIFQLKNAHLGKPTPSPLFPGVDMIRLKDRARTGFYSRDIQDIELVLAEVENKYDLTLIDTSALELKNRQNYDAQAIASCVDGVVFVKSRIDLSPELESQILEDLKSESAQLNIVGVISNSGAVV
jgi:Mrp family chromosome partitioning ATPase